MKHRSLSHRFEKLSEAIGSVIESTGMFAVMIVMSSYLKMKQAVKL